jgi:hypothetical protein
MGPAFAGTTQAALAREKRAPPERVRSSAQPHFSVMPMSPGTPPEKSTTWNRTL